MPRRFQSLIDALGSMRPSYWLFIGCLAAAVALTLAVERRRSPKISERTEMRMFYAALLAGYGACVAIASLLLSYSFGIREWIAFLFALPLGFVLLIAVGKTSEY